MSASITLDPICKKNGVNNAVNLGQAEQKALITLDDIHNALFCYKRLKEIIIVGKGLVDKFSPSVKTIYEDAVTSISAELSGDELFKLQKIFEKTLEQANLLPDALKAKHFTKQDKALLEQYLKKLRLAFVDIRRWLGVASSEAKTTYSAFQPEGEKISVRALGKIEGYIKRLFVKLWEPSKMALGFDIRTDFNKLSVEQIQERIDKAKAEISARCINTLNLDIEGVPLGDELPKPKKADVPDPSLALTLGPAPQKDPASKINGSPLTEFEMLPTDLALPPPSARPAVPARPVAPPTPPFDFSKFWSETKGKFHLGIEALGGFSGRLLRLDESAFPMHTRGVPISAGMNVGFDISDRWRLQFDSRSTADFDVQGANNLLSNSDNMSLLARYQGKGDEPFGIIFGAKYLRARTDYPSISDPNLMGTGAVLHVVKKVNPAFSVNLQAEGFAGNAETKYSQGEEALRGNTQYFPPKWELGQMAASLMPSVTYTIANNMPVTLGAYAGYGEIEQGTLFGGLAGVGYSASRLNAALLVKAYGNPNYLQIYSGGTIVYKDIFGQIKFLRTQAAGAIAQEVSASVGADIKITGGFYLQPYVKAAVGLSGPIDLGGGVSFVYGDALPLSTDPNKPNSLGPVRWRF